MPISPENKKLYPPDWRDISIRIRFGRAEGKCECRGECGRVHPFGRCGEVHGSKALTFRNRVILTTAHLNHDPSDCRDENLRAFCQLCHLRYDSSLHAQSARRRHFRESGQLTLLEGLSKAGDLMKLAGEPHRKETTDA